jgi:cytosine/uracil/thiamine/allantoin permease
MNKGRNIRSVGIVVCIVLAVVLAWLSLSAGDTMYMVYLILAGLLGVIAGVLKNMGG